MGAPANFHVLVQQAIQAGNGRAPVEALNKRIDSSRHITSEQRHTLRRLTKLLRKLSEHYTATVEPTKRAPAQERERADIHG